MKLHNTILFRSFKDCNYMILKAWYCKNKEKIEENFYQKDILMSGVIKERDGEVLEVLYLKYYADEEIKSDYIFKIYFTGQKDFHDYVSFMKFSQRRQEKDIVNKILGKIMQVSDTVILDAREYRSECLKIKTNFCIPFTNSVIPQKRSSLDIKRIGKESITENELSFVGVVSITRNNNFKEMIGYRILEKLFGANDTNGIYFGFREIGWIYTGLSGYVIDKSFFYSGAIMQYHKVHEEKVIRKIRTFSFSEKEFENAKRLVLDDFKYSIFQYGLEFTLLPYKLQSGTVTDFEQCLKVVNANDVRSKLKEICINGQELRVRVI